MNNTPILQNGTVSSASISDSASKVLSANSGRQHATLINTGSKIVYLALNASGTGLASGKGISLNANGGSYEITTNNLYLGNIYAICASGESSTIAISEN